MYLPDNEIISLIDNDILYNARLENVQQVSYDLTVAEFHERACVVTRSMSSRETLSLFQQ